MSAKIKALLLLLVLVSDTAISQSRKELERKRREKEKEIAMTRKMLNETRNKKKKSFNELQIIRQQIKVREGLIQTVNEEVVKVDGDISKKNEEIGQLDKEIEKLKNEYAEMIYLSYKSGYKSDFLTYMLASKNVNQAVKRIQYLRQVAAAREMQLEQITGAQQNLKVKVTELEGVKKEKKELITVQNDEKKELEEDKKESDQLVKQLQSKEQELKKELEAKQKALRKLANEIQALIRKEINNARKSASAKGSDTKKSSSVNVMTLTPEGKKLSADFTRNKGGLLWPVEKGFVSRRFGKIPHPDMRGIVIENNGIDISSPKGYSARAVFEGEVRAVFSIPGMQKAVMISHGDFFTVYAHLDNVVVSKGDKVKLKQQIGTIYTDEDDGKTEIHFEIWHNSVKQDPEDWLAAR